MAGDTPSPHERPLGWYQDPLERTRWRWWNGSEWTEALSAVDPSTRAKWSYRIVRHLRRLLRRDGSLDFPLGTRGASVRDLDHESPVALIGAATVDNSRIRDASGIADSARIGHVGSKEAATHHERVDDFLSFGHEQSGGLHTYHCADFLINDDVLWPGLGLQEVYPEEAWTTQNDVCQSPYRFAINANDGENLAVWRALAWAVTAGRSRFAIPCYYRDDAATLLGIEPAGIVTIDWQYEVDTEPGSLSDVDRGFVPARSMVPILPKPTRWEKAHRAKAGLFELRKFSDLQALALAVMFDLRSEITIFGLAGEDRHTRLVERLRGKTRPRLQEILENGDVFVDLAVDHDGFGQSHMTIRACEPLPEVEILTGHYRQAFHRYREAVSDIDDFEQFAMAIDQLLAPPPTTQTEPIT